MVNNVTSLTGNGFKDWIVQRATAVFLTGYFLYLFVFMVTHPHMQFEQWHGLFAATCFKIATVVALVSILLHSWIGIWTVTTDYIKCSCLRGSIQLAVVLFLLVQFTYGIMIVWGQ